MKAEAAAVAARGSQGRTAVGHADELEEKAATKGDSQKQQRDRSSRRVRWPVRSRGSVDLAIDGHEQWWDDEHQEVAMRRI